MTAQVATLADLEESRTSHQHLTFIVSDEEFAVPIMQVKEILEYGQLTQVPMVPGFIRGVINLRGSVVPVIALAAKFGKPVREITRRTCIVIMEVEVDGDEMEMGIVVDRVLQVVNIDKEHTEPSPNFGTKIQTDFIKGMGRLDEHFVIILDINRVLSAEEIVVISQVQSSAQAEFSVDSEQDQGNEE